MKTIKTIAIAAVMTVIGATTVLANNTNPRKPNHNNAHAPRVEMNHHHHISKGEYMEAKRCHCHTCREVVKRYEMQMRERNHNANPIGKPNNHNVCPNGMNNNHNAPTPAPAPNKNNNNRPAGGRH